LLEKKAELDERDLGKQPLTVAELDALIGPRSHLDYLNTKNELYRARKMKEHPPTREETIRLMAKEPNLIRRPILRRGNQWVFGFDAERFQSLLK
jgi:arsenate reductase-like glutaredoxin family protein